MASQKRVQLRLKTFPWQKDADISSSPGPVALGRQSNLTSGEEFNLSTMAFKWIDSVGSHVIPVWSMKKENKKRLGARAVGICDNLSRCREV
ncbi:hypothetical protein R1sor_019308 [Riccia sorocarpa]|uniref:Uncharacterized protein n=1 Tax=Riccia sorocarpa TaxID=122646 RepID=A0ABD3ICQ7_9MARC